MILKTWGATIYENLLACTPSSRSQISTVVSSTLAGKETPALLNRISSRPCAAVTAFTTWAQFCSGVTSRCR
jgi:hypothetical protein